MNRKSNRQTKNPVSRSVFHANTTSKQRNTCFINNKDAKGKNRRIPINKQYNNHITRTLAEFGDTIIKGKPPQRSLDRLKNVNETRFTLPLNDNNMNIFSQISQRSAVLKAILVDQMKRRSQKINNDEIRVEELMNNE